MDPNYEPHFKLGRSGPAGCPATFFARRILGWYSALRRARPALARFALLLALAAAFKDVTATHSRPTYWVEKTPRSERYVERLATFSEARFIQMVRHPSATLASIIESERSAGRRESDPAEHARHIAQSLRLSQKRARQLKGRYLVLRYEDLVEEPAREMERVRTFLGIAPSHSLLTPTEVGSAVRSNSSFAADALGKINRLRRSPTLSPLEARVISAFSAAAARPLGYQVEPLGMLTRTAIQLRRYLTRTG